MAILIVDDSPTTRLIVRKELDEGGYEVMEAESGQQALEQVRQHKPELITLGVEMPGMDGFEFCARLRAPDADGGGNGGMDKTPVIFLTAGDTLEQREKGFDAGATEFITKPFMDGELREAVDRILKPVSDLAGAKAVVIDDSDVTRHVVSNALKGLGVEVLEAADGASGLELIKAHASEVDLVVTDMMMPGMSGDALCRELRADPRFHGLPVIALSGFTEKVFVLEMFRAGVTDYVVKPCPMEELVARVSIHLHAQKLNRELTRHVDELKDISRHKDKFLAITSHDLRSPLTGILGFADLILSGAADAEQQSDFVERIRAAGQYLLELINDLQDLSRIQAQEQQLELTSLSLAGVADSAMQTLRHMATPKGISLSMDNLCEGDPLILGDWSAIMRVMTNLLSNAIKFTNENGEVKITIEPGEAGKLKVSVADNGIGIPEDKIPQLFDDYSKASHAGTAGEKGTGLGMSITRHLVDQHNGSIEVKSREGEGSTFTLIFPANE